MRLSGLGKKGKDGKKDHGENADDRNDQPDAPHNFLSLLVHMGESYFTKQFKNGEEILEIVRPAWIAYLPMGVVGTLLTLLPFFLLFYLFRWHERGVLAFLVLLAIGAGVLARTIFLARRNGVLMTRERIVDVEQRGLFHKVVSDTPYAKIEESRYEQRGPLAMMFGYGTVVIQTQGAGADIEIRYARDPKRLHEMIEGLREHAPPSTQEENEAVNADEYTDEQSEGPAQTFERKL